MKSFLATTKSKAVPFFILLQVTTGFAINHHSPNISERGKSNRETNTEWDPYGIVMKRMEEMESDTFGKKALLYRVLIRDASKTYLEHLELEIKKALKEQEKIYLELKGIQSWTEKTATESQQQAIQTAVEEANKRVTIALNLALDISRKLNGFIEEKADSSIDKPLPSEPPPPLLVPRVQPPSTPKLFPKLRQFIEPR